MDDNSANELANDGYTRKQIRRTNRNLLLWNGLLLAVLAALGWWARDYYYNFFLGPFRWDDAEVLAAARDHPDDGLIAYVELAGRPRELTPTGFTEVSTSDGRPYSTQPFSLTRVGEQWLLVMGQPKPGSRLLGPVYRVPAKVQREVVAPLEQKRAELRGHVLPVMLNAAAAFPVAGYVGLAVLGPLTIFGLVNVARGTLRALNPGWHPLARPADEAVEIDRAMEAGDAEQFGPVLLAGNWLLRPTPFGVTRVPLDRVVWAFHRVVGGRHAVVLRFNNGKTVTVLVKRGTGPAAVQAVGDRVPRALLGHDPALDAAWRRRPMEAIAMVNERRRDRRT